MNDNPSVNNDKNINDLIKMSHGSGGRIQVSPDEVEEKLKNKMQEMQEKKEEAAVRQAADEAGVGYVSLKGFPISPEALSLTSEEEAKNLKAVCFLKTDAEVRLGAINPLDEEVAQILKRIEEGSRARGRIYQISERSLAAALKLYAVIPKPYKFIGGIEITSAELDRFKGEISSFREIHDKIQHVSTSDMVAMIMSGAIRSNASDIHIESGLDNLKIRFRIDGVLYDVATLPKEVYAKVMNRIKLVAKLKINVTNVPQDGRFTIYLAQEFIDVRVSTVPSAYGESVVMRLLMSSATALTLENLGLVGISYEILKKEIERPNGMILTTGPTGSGKTSTLYAFLKKLNTPDQKIITLENPIEYRVKGVIQSQVEASEQEEEGSKNIKELLTGSGTARKHYTYSSGLRAVLRQDPDIVMVGEIRDHETAEIAIQAALTGHLMLSTLHTNSAAGAIPRLLSMEVKPFLLAPALNVVIGQRLVRRICPQCKEEYALTPELLQKAQGVIDSIAPDKRGGVDKNNLKFYRGKGCSACNNIGYRGRVGIFEVLTMNEEIEKLILTGQVSEYQIKDIAKKHGMITMLQDGTLKSVQGITAIEEVFESTD